MKQGKTLMVPRQASVSTAGGRGQAADPVIVYMLTRWTYPLGVVLACTIMLVLCLVMLS